jgi:predicted Rossmann fold flavoprotein
MRLNENAVKGSYFCKSSKDILTIFQKEIKNIAKFLNFEVVDVKYENEVFHIISKNRTILAKKLVVASGGLSFPNLGATDIAFKIGKKFGHSIENLNPALVGFTVQKEQFWFKNLSGISLKAKAKIGEKELSGNLLFTHKGCSGPLILSSSLYWTKGKIILNFAPDFNILKNLNKRQQISTVLQLPKKFTLEFLKEIGIKDKPMNQLSNSDVEKLRTIQNYQFSPAGNFGYSRAEITKGGISTDEVNPKTMESKIQKNLFFIGEALNVGGELGGFNIHFAFSSAYSINILP